jgi:RNA polymerase sigma factor for flagellar operon FliA
MQATTTRAHLIETHADMARRIALKLARRCPAWITRDDLVGASMVGLIEAADRYDHTRAEPFGAFAEQRIRGAVLDELRRGDLLPRRVRQTARRIASAIHAIEIAGGAATEAAIAAQLDVSVPDYQTHYAHVARFGVDSLDDKGAAVPVDDAESPEDTFARRQLLDRVHRALDEVGARDVSILVMYYAGEQTFQEIGDRLGITPSRVCQLLRRTVARVRDAFVDDEAAVEIKLAA